MKTHHEFLRPSLQVMFLIFLSVTLCGTDAALASASPVQPQPIGIKTDSSGELAADIPPRVFPRFSNEDEVPIRQGEEVPPSVFPKERVSMSNEQHVNGSKANVTSPVNETTSTKKVASEVQDLLKSDMYNITTYEDGTEGSIPDTVTVTGPHVVNNGKTHEEDATASSMENKGNLTKNPGMSVLPTSDTNNSTFDSPNISNMSITVDFAHSGNTTEVAQRTENGTHPVETVEAHNDAPVTEVHIPAKDDERNNSVSENNVQRKEEVTPDTGMMQNETTAKSESVSSITQQLSTIKLTSIPPIEQSTIANVQPTLKVESTTSAYISENLVDHTAENTLLAMATSQKDGDHSNESSGKSSPFLKPTESAAILAAVFVGVALIGYVGLLVWRRVLERRYGSREMLVNEDDFYDTNDMKNFEL